MAPLMEQYYALLICIAVLAMQVVGVGAAEELAFDNSLQADQLALVTVVACVTGIALVVTLGCAVSSKSLRLPVILVASVWVIVLAVGTVTWGVTYATSREVIHEKANKILKATAFIVKTVESDLSAGQGVIRAMALQARSGHFDPTDADPADHPFSYVYNMLRATGKFIPAIHLLYYGTEDGLFFSITPPESIDDTVNVFVNSGGPLRYPPPVWSVCSPWYDRSGSCLKENCGDTDIQEDIDCGLTCGVNASSEHCTTRYDPAGEYKLRMLRGRLRWSDETQEFTQDGYDPITLTYDPRSRPWYVKQNDTLLWSQPYLFAVAQVPGITSSVGMQRRDGSYAGVLGVDFSLSSFSKVLQTAKPTQQSIIVMVTAEGKLVSSSLTLEESAADTGIPASSLVNVLEIPKPGSRIRAIFNSVVSEYGSIAHIGSYQVTRDGEEVIVTTSVSLPGGLVIYAVIAQPYCDLMGDADTASTTALVAALGISALSAAILFVGIAFALRPLHRLASSMEDVSWMRFEGLDNIPTSNFIWEVQWMQRSFQQMADNLKEYKKFLPKAMIDEGEPVVAVSQRGGGVCIESVSAAVVFTDINNSTSIWESSPDGMRRALKMHNQIVRSSIATYKGTEVKTLGDAFMVVFDSVHDAVNFGLSIQKELLSAEWPKDLLALHYCSRSEDGSWGGLTVRVGIDYGACDIETNVLTGKRDFFGNTVNKAARLEASCVGGAVCITEGAFSQVGGDLPAVGNPCVIEFGRAQLKGVKEETSLLFLIPSTLLLRAPQIEASFPEMKRRFGIEEVSTESSQGKRRCVLMSHDKGIEKGHERFKEKLQKFRAAVIGHVELRFGGGILTDHEDPVPLVREGLSTVSDATHRTGGQIITVLGASISFGWTPLQGHSAHGVHAENAFRFVSLLYNNRRGWFDVQYYAGLCMGPVLWGNVGAGGQRFVTSVGPAVCLAVLLSRSAMDLGAFCLHASLLAGGSPLLASAVHGLPLARPVDEWTIEGERKIVVYEVSDKSAIAEAANGGPSPSRSGSTSPHNAPRPKSPLSQPGQVSLSFSPLPSIQGAPPELMVPQSHFGSTGKSTIGGVAVAPVNPLEQSFQTPGEDAEVAVHLDMDECAHSPLPCAVEPSQEGFSIEDSASDLPDYGQQGQGSTFLPDWGWGEAYRDAFFQKNAAEIKRKAAANDAIASRVAGMLQRSEHLRLPISSLFLEE